MKSYILLGLAVLYTHLSLAQIGTAKAEVFIQIENRGSYTVYLDNEFIGSNKGKFRFYDVLQSSPTLSILQDNQKIYSKKIELRNNERLILSFSVRQGLRILKTLNIYRNGQYALNNFDDYVGTYNTGIVPPNRPRAEHVDPFENLFDMVKKEPWDDQRISLVLAYTTNNFLSTAQAASLLKTFSFDDKKLSLAKSLFPSIADVQNYYTLKDVFAFISTKEEFISYLNTSQLTRPRTMMRNSSYEQLRENVKRESFDDDKTKLVQVVLQNALISTGQLAELLKLYAFEDKALLCAKQAYGAVSDKQNFFTLQEIFKFRTTQDALLDFLGRKN